MRQPRATQDHSRRAAATALVIAGDGRVTGPEIDRLGVDLTVGFGENSGGRLCVTSVTVSHPEGVTGNLLRQLPLAGIEKRKSRQAARFVAQMDQFMQRHNERSALVRLKKMLDKLPATPRGGDLPDSFYELVAACYLMYVTQVTPTVSTPSRLIAKATGTPDSTVRGWVRKARLRGYLPPARKGTAG